ncbi:MAG: hypothetical protein ACJ746_12285 [Bryobacteraceae bacterium]
MKSRAFASAALLGLLMMPFAHAQSRIGLKGNIPFEFRIGDKTLPAGEYSFDRNGPGGKLVLMRNLDYMSGNAIFTSYPVQAKSLRESETPNIVFHRYGGTYFLSQVWQGWGESTGLQLQKSKAERIVAHQMASLRNPENVEVAMLSFKPTVK